ncbi:hypothetical protein HPB52_017256 [Rhipicephalus sanguineus]|uniref:Uncharacterized protein n=1 Tax=Rhipicephalus sanguineus TaxID=34632 RepID=A0A9D4Q184_RHISA|nr:hypothetical protein HPB52_017256 [Rhipicephalus sanguineus]
MFFFSSTENPIASLDLQGFANLSFRCAEELHGFFHETKTGGPNQRLSFLVSIVTSAQEKVLNHRLSKDGSLVVTISKLPTANHLLAATELAGVAVEAQVPYSYTANYGKMHDVPLTYSNEHLREYYEIKASFQQGGLTPSHLKMEARSNRHVVDLFYGTRQGLTTT